MGGAAVLYLVRSVVFQFGMAGMEWRIIEMTECLLVERDLKLDDKMARLRLCSYWPPGPGCHALKPDVEIVKSVVAVAMIHFNTFRCVMS